MKKIFLYDDSSFELLTCLLMGVDSNGKPQLVVTTPGMPVESFKDHVEGYRKDRLYSYLGEEGDTIPAIEIIHLFTGYLVMSAYQHQDLAELIKSLKLAGLKWCDDYQKLIFEVRHHQGMEDDEEDYMSLYVYLDIDGECCMAYSYDFTTLREVLDRIHLIIHEISNRADIPLTCELRISKKLQKDLTVGDLVIFDNIHTDD